MSANRSANKLSARFETALVYASRLHASQSRKGNNIPYIAHLLAVTSMVLEDGGDEDQAIAALLHDAAEDQGGVKTLEEIRARYGDRVAYIVEGCTDAYGFPKPPWRQRKELYIEHLRLAGPDIRRVSLADKLHNARSILCDLRHDCLDTMERFNGGKNGTLWYYKSLLAVFELDETSPMVGELRRVVEAIEHVIQMD